MDLVLKFVYALWFVAITALTAITVYLNNKANKKTAATVVGAVSFLFAIVSVSVFFINLQ
ncbi:MAG: hypothetical protein Q8882_06330 [Bacillota bacterium]|nr:hypothetical protein [Bacillota bacterium]